MTDEPSQSLWKKTWPWEFTAIGIALIGVLARLLPWRYIFSGGEVILQGVDPYYHLRRAKLLLEHFPETLQFDPFISFPGGGPIPWPPGFDFLVALPGLLTGSPAQLSVWGSISMPLLGGFTVYLTYRLGRRVFDPLIGLVAAALVAIMPGAIHFTSLGRVDHHALVAPVCLGMYLAFLASQASDSRRKSISWACLCGLLAAYAVASWIVTPPLYFIPIPLTLLILCLSKRRAEVGLAALACMASSWVFVLIVVLLSGNLEEAPFSFYMPSWLILILYTLACAAIAIAYLRATLFYLFAGFTIAATGALLLLAPEWASPLTGIFEIVAGGDPSYSIVGESQALFFSNGLFTVRRATLMYTYLIILWPLIALAFIRHLFKKTALQVSQILFAIFMLMGCCTLTIQQRFGEYAAPALAILLAWGMVFGLRLIFDLARRPQSNPRFKIWAWALTLAVVLSLSPIVEGLIFLANSDPVGPQRDLIAFGRELKRHTPAPGRPDGDRKPQYGLLTGWMDAHPLLEVTDRPVAVSSFGTAQALAGNRAAFKMLLNPNEEDSVREMRQAKLRYVVISPIVTEIAAMANIAGLASKYVEVSTGYKDGQSFKTHQPLKPFADCLHTRLLLADGSQEAILEVAMKPLAHFRLILESQARTLLFGLEIPAIRAFELVAGAELKGRVEAQQTVSLRLGVQSNTGRVFTYKRSTTADQNGDFSFVVPYATEDQNGPCQTTSPYRIKVADRVWHVRVGEQAVRQGLEIFVPAT